MGLTLPPFQGGGHELRKKEPKKKSRKGWKPLKSDGVNLNRTGYLLDSTMVVWGLSKTQNPGQQNSNIQTTTCLDTHGTLAKRGPSSSKRNHREDLPDPNTNLESMGVQKTLKMQSENMATRSGLARGGVDILRTTGQHSNSVWQRKKIETEKENRRFPHDREKRESCGITQVLSPSVQVTK